MAYASYASLAYRPDYIVETRSPQGSRFELYLEKQASFLPGEGRFSKAIRSSEFRRLTSGNNLKFSVNWNMAL